MTTIPGPKFLGDGREDELYRLCLSLLRELWVVTDRVRVLEAALVVRGVLDAGAVDGHRPSEELRKDLAQERALLIERVLGNIPLAATTGAAEGQ